MARRGQGILAATIAVATMTCCATESTSEPGTSSVQVQTTTPQGAEVGAIISTPPDADVEAIVSAAGGGGLIDAVEVTGLAALGQPAVGQPWLRFDLVLRSCCSEPNSVVFAPGPQGFDTSIGMPPALRLSGPACGGPVMCTDGSRTVALTGSGPVPLSFELTPLVDAGALLAAGSMGTVLAPLFDFAHPGLDDAAMSIELRIDIGARPPPPAGDTTPTATPSAPVTSVGGGFQLLTFPFAAVADDAEQLAAILAPSTEPVDTSTLGIDWATHAAIVLTIPTDGCPPLLAGLEVTDRRAEPVFVAAGYLACIEPLLSHTVIASVERAVLTDVDELVLPADPLFFETPVVAPVDVTPSAPPAPSAPPPAPSFGEVAGTADLPLTGEATVATLTNGTPVYVVRHHDGTLSALDPRAASDSVDATGLLHLVTWTAMTRNFLGGGAWDEYGRRLDGFRTTDLQGFATRVDGDVVEIGSSVDPPVGSPVVASADPPAMSNASIPVDEPITLDEARALPTGDTGLIDAAVVVDPDGAHVCTAGSSGFPIAACPPGSLVADGVAPTVDARTAWFGPILATRTDTGFSRVAPTGGSTGGAL